MSKDHLPIFLVKIMAIFTKGERVRIIEIEKNSDKVYIIKDIKKYKKGGILYLLRILDESHVLRLYYENSRSLLERIC